jgi:hypothetical protein
MLLCFIKLQLQVKDKLIPEKCLDLVFTCRESTTEVSLIVKERKLIRHVGIFDNDDQTQDLRAFFFGQDFVVLFGLKVRNMNYFLELCPLLRMRMEMICTFILLVMF